MASVFVQNVMGAPGLQFDYCQDPASLIGHDAVMVVPHLEIGARNTNRAGRRFESLDRVERVVVERLGTQVMSADIRVGRDYRGSGEPTDRQPNKRAD